MLGHFARLAPPGAWLATLTAGLIGLAAAACSDDSGPAAECDLTPDCEPGHVCIDQRCWQAVSCATDADCNGFVCQDGACVDSGADASHGAG